MSHLHETGQSYLTHLLRAWKIAFTLLVHGLFPNIWKTKASVDKQNADRGLDIKLPDMPWKKEEAK